jgi:hypothetical protein
MWTRCITTTIAPVRLSSKRDRRVLLLTDASAPDLGSRIIRLERIVDDNEITSAACQCAADRGCQTASPRCEFDLVQFWFEGRSTDTSAIG